MAGTATVSERQFLADAFARLLPAGRSWAMGAPGARVWELSEILRPLEFDIEQAIACDAPWDGTSQRRIRSTLVALERFGRLYAPAILKIATETLKLYDNRLKVELVEGFNPAL